MNDGEGSAKLEECAEALAKEPDMFGMSINGVFGTPKWPGGMFGIPVTGMFGIPDDGRFGLPSGIE